VKIQKETSTASKNAKLQQRKSVGESTSKKELREEKRTLKRGKKVSEKALGTAKATRKVKRDADAPGSPKHLTFKRHSRKDKS
jgi:hypothetical protein